MGFNVQMHVTNLQQLRSEVARFCSAEAVPIRAVLADQMRLMAQDLLKWTPPTGQEQAHLGQGMKGAKFGKSSQQRKQGRARVEADIMALFIDRDEVAAHWDLKGRGARKIKNIPGSAQMLAQGIRFTDNQVFAIDGQLWRPNASMAELKAHHQQYRMGTGRVTRAAFSKNQIGRYKFINRMVTSGKAIRALVKEKQQNVGALKSGWVPAIRYFERLSGGRSRGGVPAWVEKAGQKTGYGRDGYGMDNFNAATWTGSFVAGNTVPYNARHITNRILTMAVNKRRADVQRQLRLRVEGMVRRWNLQSARNQIFAARAA